MDLLLALDTISNASDECLHSHATQIILTLGRVGQRLQHNLLAESPDFQTTPTDPPSVPSPPQSPQLLQAPRSLSLQTDPRYPRVPSPPQSPLLSQLASSPCSQTTESSSDPHEVRSPQSPQTSVSQGSTQPLTTPADQLIPGGGPSPSNVPPNHVPDLLRRVKRSVVWVWEVSQKEQSHILSRKRNSDDDPRLEHIRRVEGDGYLSNDAKLLRLLALRSIALEFTNRQIEDKVSLTKLDELCQHAMLPTPTSDNIFRYDSKDFSSKALATGLKHLAMEKIIAGRFQQCGLPPIFHAISALTGLHRDQFRRLRYNEMLNFAEQLLSEASLLDFMRDIGPWFNQLQNFYNVIYKSPVSAMDSRRHKCPRPNPVDGPEVLSNPTERLVEVPEVPIPLSSEFPPADFLGDELESRNLGDCTEAELAHIFYEQLSTQPFTVSEVMDDIATRACLDFDSICPQHDFSL